MEKQQLEKYINEYGRDIYLFCKRLTQNKNTADDLYQETFLKLWELDNVNDTENPKSYLLGISVNLWKNQCRKQMWRKRIADIVPASEESQIEHFSAADSVEDTVISNQEKLLVVVFVKGKQHTIREIPKNELGFICLSGLATGGSWICYYKALHDGMASVVVPIDKLSILVSIAFSFIVFKEHLTKKAAVGLCLIIAGTLTMLL